MGALVNLLVGLQFMMDSKKIGAQVIIVDFFFKYRKSSNIRRPQKMVTPNFGQLLIFYRGIPMRPIFNLRPFLKSLDQGL